MDQQADNKFDNDIPLVLRPRKHNPPKEQEIIINQSRVIQIKRAIKLLISKSPTHTKPRFMRGIQNISALPPKMNIGNLIKFAEPTLTETGEKKPVSPHKLSREYILDDHMIMLNTSYRQEVFLRQKASSFFIGKSTHS